MESIVHKGIEYFLYLEKKRNKHYVSKCGKVVFTKHNSNEIFETAVSLDNRGYLRCVNGQIHIIVAKTFIPNTENKPMVNHIDGNKHNNCFSNLEWCTNSENMKHANDTGLYKNRYLLPITIVRYGKVYEFENGYAARDYCKKNFDAHILNWMYSRGIPKRRQSEFQFVGYSSDYNGGK